MAAIAESIAEAQNEILIFGVAAPILLGFLWLLLLKLFARTMVYTGLATIGTVLVLFTLYCFLMSGLYGELTANVQRSEPHAMLKSQCLPCTAHIAGSSVLQVTLPAQNITGNAPTDDAYAQAMGMTSEEAMVEMAGGTTVDTGGDPTLWYLLGAISLLLTFLYILTVCLARKKISKAVDLVKESTNVIIREPVPTDPGVRSVHSSAPLKPPGTVRCARGRSSRTARRWSPSPSTSSSCRRPC